MGKDPMFDFIQVKLFPPSTLHFSTVSVALLNNHDSEPIHNIQMLLELLHSFAGENYRATVGT